MATGGRQQRGEATRREIIEVARQLFSEHGYHNTGIADIQAATGLTKGAFYHHFRAKEDLALAVLEAVECDYAELLIGPAMEHSSPGQRIAALLDGAVSLNARPEWRNCQLVVTLCAELTAGDGHLTAAVRALQARQLARWRELITEAQKKGEAATAVPAAVWAQWIMNTLTGALVLRKIGVAEVEPGMLINQIKHLLLLQGEPHDRNRVD